MFRYWMIPFAPGIGLALGFCWLFGGLLRVLSGGTNNEGSIIVFYMMAIFFNVLIYIGLLLLFLNYLLSR